VHVRHDAKRKAHRRLSTEAYLSLVGEEGRAAVAVDSHQYVPPSVELRITQAAGKRVQGDAKVLVAKP